MVETIVFVLLIVAQRLPLFSEALLFRGLLCFLAFSYLEAVFAKFLKS